MSAALVHFILRQRESRVHRNIPDRCDPLHHRDEDLLGGNQEFSHFTNVSGEVLDHRDKLSKQRIVFSLLRNYLFYLRQLRRFGGRAGV